MLRALLKIVLLLLLAWPLILIFGWYFSAPGYVGPISDHFDGKRFHNENERDQKGLWDFLKWYAGRSPGKWPESRPNRKYPKPDPRVSGDQFRITFINHATVLIQVAGLNILTDPIWSERCSPVSFAGPKRARDPGVAFDDLPPIDLVLISHNHYDHLDLPTIKTLQDRDHPRFFVGLGNIALLDANGITNTTDLDWWQSENISSGVSIWGVPAQHFSGRGLADRDETLWMGFVVDAPGAKIYFAGDTGFGPHFQQIREKFGKIDLALLPIGAFLPKWFMSYVHISPRQALEAAEVLAAKHSIGIHFGTFQLGDDGEDEPPKELARAHTGALAKIDFRVLDFGQSLDFNILPK